MCIYTKFYQLSQLLANSISIRADRLSVLYGDLTIQALIKFEKIKIIKCSEPLNIQTTTC